MAKRLIKRPAGQSINNYWKLRAFKRLGGFMCACCEEKRKPFLTIDHINGKGIAHRKQFKGGHGAFYKWIATTADDVSLILRVLCMNCNWGTRHGPCPHVRDNKVEQSREMADALQDEIETLEKQRDRLKDEILNYQQLRDYVQPKPAPTGWVYVRHIGILDAAELAGDTSPEATGAEQQLAQK